MSELYPVGSWYISYFLSDQFDNIFKSWATPTRVAFTTGLGIGLGVGLGVGLAFGYSGRNLKGRITAIASVVPALLPKRKTGTLHLDGDFKMTTEAMLENVSRSFANDNELFSRLRESMNCQLALELAEGGIRSLMNAVAPGLMVDYNDSNLSVANFFYLVIEFLKDSEKVNNELVGQANGLTRRCFEADILLIHAEDDSELAAEMKESIKSNGVSVKLDGDVGIGQGRLSRFENVFKKYIYVCILVTDRLKDDKLANFVGQMCIICSLYDVERRFIPVQTTGIDTRAIVKKCPTYGSLHPWKYGTDRSDEQLESLIQNANKALFETTNSNE